MQKCTRCGARLPEEAFESPLSMCLVCYSNVPANEGLSLLQLRDKAKKSRLANKKLRNEQRLEQLGLLKGHAGQRSSKMSISQVKEFADNMPVDTREWKPCFYCKEDYPVEDLRERPGPEGPLKMVLYCLGCAAEGFKIKSN